MTPSRDVWQGKSVLLTGHTGFKGGWLTLWLDIMGAKVHGYSLEPPTSPCLYDVARVADAVASDTRADVCDLESLQTCVAACRPEIVLHLAAQPLVVEGYRDPVRTFQSNVIGTVNVLEAVRNAASVKAVVVVTTDKVYENRELHDPYREVDPLGGSDPYSASKAAAEMVAAAYRASFFGRETPAPVAVATARAGNVIGGGDWGANRLVPDCVRAFAAGQPVKLKHPASVRPWQHVLDCLSGYLCLAEHLLDSRGHEYAGAWNFSPAAVEDATVGEIATLSAQLWGGSARVEEETVPAEFREAGVLRLDSAEARRRLSWSSRWSLRDSLSRTVDWYRRWADGEDMASFSRGQIRSFEESRA